VDGLAPEQFDEPVFPAHELRPWHVVLYHRDESELHAALSTVPVRIKKLKPCTSGRFVLPQHAELFNLSDGEVDELSSGSWVHGSEEDMSGSSQHACAPSACLQIEVVHTFIPFKDDLDGRSIRTW